MASTTFSKPIDTEVMSINSKIDNKLNGFDEIYGSSSSVNNAKLGSFQCVYTSAQDTPGDKGIVYTGGAIGGTERWQLFIGSYGLYRRHFISNAWTAWTTI